MASSSQNTFDESSDDTFDDIFDQKFDEKFDQFFDQAFENLNIRGAQKKENPELILKEIVKKGIFIYGMIIYVILQRILIIYSDDVFE